MSNENLSEGKLPSDFQKSDKKKLLGIILEETNNIILFYITTIKNFNFK